MNIYSKKQKLKLGLFIIAVLMGTGIVWYSGNLVEQLADREHNRIEIWAESVKELTELDLDVQISPTLYKILGENTTIPVMLIDDTGVIIDYRNLSEKAQKDSASLYRELDEMKENGDPIIIEYTLNKKNYVYYKDSVLLTNLFYYPYIQFLVVAFFIVISYLAFSSSRKAEENQLWASMSRETAHQLGTPISSLVAWVEMLKLKGADEKLTEEVQKDVKRLETITERFSGIGSTPVLVKNNIYMVLSDAISYLKVRTSGKIEYVLNYAEQEELFIPVNESLFEWVIENMCKNAIDAMQGRGKIVISVFDKKDRLFIDIQDTGKGIPMSQYNTVFKPGFTTKKRGWGLGLSLVKRIIESYHSGKVFVKSSEINKGTTFRIVLNK